MDWLNPFSILLGLTGAIYWILATYMKSHPPKKINQLYGYRTKRSMSSQERWDFAQLYSSNVLQRSGLILMASALVRVWTFSMHEAIDIVLSMAIVIGSCIYLLLVTEKALKEKFG